VGREHALVTAEYRARQSGRWVWITEDFRDAFTQVPRRRLLDVLRSQGLDARTLDLIHLLIGNERRGISQGSCLSPLLLNLYLDHFLDRPWRGRFPDVPLIRVADDLLILATDQAEADECYRVLQEMSTTIGMPLKGNATDSIRRLARGEHTDRLGYRICLADQIVQARIAPKAWNRIADRLARAHAEPQAVLRVPDVIAGWAEQLGACYRQDQHREVYARVATMAQDQGFEEIPSFEEFAHHWAESYVRYYHLRRASLLRLDGRSPDASTAQAGLPPTAAAAEPRSGRVSGVAPDVRLYTGSGRKNAVSFGRGADGRGTWLDWPGM
jgi:hypothetical protein